MIAKLLLAACLTLGMLSSRRAHAIRPAFVYVNANPNQSANSVSAFRVDGAGLSKALPASPFATGGMGLAPASGAEFAHRIEVSRSRNLLYAANDGSGTIAAFTIDPLSGNLLPVAGSPFTVPGWGAFSGISLAVSNDGRFLYASGPTLVSFFIDDFGGLWQTGSRWVFGQRVGGLAVSSDNTRLYLTTFGGVFILSTGEAGLDADLPEQLSIGSTPTDLRLDFPGKRLWVGTKNGGIMAYSLFGTSRTVVPGAPFFLGVSDLSGLSADFYGRFVMAFSPTGPRLFGAHSNADGSLVAPPNSPINPALPPTSAALSPDGSLLFVTGVQGQLDAWATSEDGALRHADGYPITPSGATPGYPSIATFPDKTPTPAPASPQWLLLALAASCALIGAQRLRFARCD